MFIYWEQPVKYRNFIYISMVATWFIRLSSWPGLSYTFRRFFLKIYWFSTIRFLSGVRPSKYQIVPNHSCNYHHPVSRRNVNFSDISLEGKAAKCSFFRNERTRLYVSIRHEQNCRPLRWRSLRWDHRLISVGRQTLPKNRKSILPYVSSFCFTDAGLIAQKSWNPQKNDARGRSDTRERVSGISFYFQG